MSSWLSSGEDRLAFAACIAHVAGDLGDPPPRPRGADPLSTWRAWLAERGLGLVEVSDPGRFQLAGYWIALLAGHGAEPRPVVMFGVPSGPVFDPRGVELPDGEPVAGFVLVPLDLRRSSVGAERRRGAADAEGRLERILVAADREAPMREVEGAELTADGVEGDRYRRGEGTFSNPASNGHAVTLIEQESLDATELPHGGRASAEEMRRNLVTSGIELNTLVGQRFRVGEALLIGRRPCEPCAHLQRITRPGILRAFIHRGGLRADVLEPGRVRAGDTIAALATTADAPGSA